MDEHRENPIQRRDRKYKKDQTEVTELKNAINELKNTLAVFNSRLDEMEEQISYLEDKALELTQRRKNKKEFRKLKIREIYKTSSSTVTFTF